MASNVLSARSQSLSAAQTPPPPTAPFAQNDPITNKAAQTTVTCVYQTHIAGFWRNVTVLWGKNLMNYSLSLSVDSVDHDHLVYTCKIDLKPWHFWAKKGYKTFEVDGNQIEAYWDLRSAKFSGSPEPFSDFYVALVSDEEVVLLLGDMKKKAYKRTKARPALVDPTLFYKRENVFGKKSFSTRAKFDRRKREHEIVVESSTVGPRDPEMWISIDGIVMIHIVNLQWKFRGNQTVMVNKQPIHVYWDVHAWLFCPAGLNHGLFIFKSGEDEDEDEDEGEGEGEGEEVEETNSSKGGENSECSTENSNYYSTKSHSKGLQFCLFLYAWKIE